MWFWLAEIMILKGTRFFTVISLSLYFLSQGQFVQPCDWSCFQSWISRTFGTYSNRRPFFASEVFLMWIHEVIIRIFFYANSRLHLSQKHGFVDLRDFPSTEPNLPTSIFQQARATGTGNVVLILNYFERSLVFLIFYGWCIIINSIFHPHSQRILLL